MKEKILKLFVVSVLIILILPIPVFARLVEGTQVGGGSGGGDKGVIDSVIEGADNFLNVDNTSILDENSIKTVSDTLYNMFSAVGVAIVLIVGAILGIQFIMGSVEEKAEIKEKLIPYVIGSIVIFGAIGIWSLVANVLSGVFWQ